MCPVLVIREKEFMNSRKLAGLPGFLLLILTNDGALAVEPGVQFSSIEIQPI